MKIWQLLMVLGLLLVTRGTLAAPQARPGAAPADYHFGPGDVIDVTVTPQHNFDRTVTVQPDGKISYPLVGQLQVAGLTVSQLVEKLHEGLNHDLVDPVVTLSLREASKHALGRVSLLGAVHSPGGLEINEGATLADALASSGGPSPTADLRRVTITRADGSVTTVDLAQTDRTGRVEQNVPLQPGDIIVVPEGAPPTVLVLGDVSKPGSYEIPRDARLLDAFSRAGGATEKADLRRVTLARQGVPGSRTLDLQPLLAKGDTSDPELNLLLQPGDTIFVPETEQQIYVLGSVAKPGLYPIRPTDRVLDVLVTAGGAGAGVSKAVLVRRGADGHPVARNLDLNKILAKGDQAENALLQPGDVLYVPDKKNHSSTGGLLNLLSPLTSVLYFLH
jgi:polysaccharide export outer membrane protein